MLYKMPLKMEFELPNPPTDGITNVTFSPVPGSSHLLVSSWDKSVRLYDTTIAASESASGAQLVSYSHSNAVLDCIFSDESHTFSAGLDRTLQTYDLTAQKQSTLGLFNAHAFNYLYY